MSRNGSGTYAVPNTFTAGTTITASSHNQNWSDLASEMTNSVAADGQTTMTGPLKAANGTAAAPSVAFASDLDSGLYRIGANNLGVAVNGTKVVDVATTGVTVTGDVNATTVKQGSFALLPVGLVMPYAGSSAPSGYLLCYGQAVSRTTYASLFDIIGTTFGSGNGSTTFNLPDLRGRVAAGGDAMGGSAAGRLTDAVAGIDGLGDAGGAQSRTLATANLPAYTPSGSMSGSAVNFQYSQISTGATGGSQNVITAIVNSGGGQVMNANVTQPTFTGSAQGGTSTAFAIVQPTLVLNYIIFAGV